MHRNIAIFALSLIAIVPLATGCGSSDGDSIDKETFVQRAEVICKKASGRLAAKTKAQAQEEFNTSPTQSAIRIITTIAAPVLEVELRELRALGLPSEDREQVESFLTSLQQSVASAKSKPVAFANGSSPPYEAAELASQRLGMPACPITTVGAG